jgi:WXG100 family type VII secretion target
MPLGTEMNEEVTRHMMAAMNQTDADCDAAQRAVDATSSYLDANWHGDAKNKFTGSIQQWQEALSQVKNGLRELNQAMNTYYTQSIQLEQDNSSLASWT